MATRTLVSVSNSVKRQKQSSTTVTASTSYTVADSGQTFDIATDAIVQTLPLIDSDNIGMRIKFRNTGADGNNIITISPASADGINGSVANATADSVASGTVNKDFVNTKATANNGDYVELEAVATTKWFVVGGVGIWASQV